MTPPTVTPEEMIAAIEDRVSSHDGVLRGWLPDEQRAAFDRERVVFVTVRDFIRQHATKDAAVAKSVEEGFEEFRRDHFRAAHPAVETCLPIAFAYGYSAGRRHSMAEALTAAGRGFAAKDAEIDALKQRVGELERENAELEDALSGCRATINDIARLVGVGDVVALVAELAREIAELRVRLGNCVWRSDDGRVCGLPRASHGLCSGLHGYTAPDTQPTPDTDGPEAFSRALQSREDCL